VKIKKAVKISVLLRGVAIMGVLLMAGLWTQQAVAVPILNLPTSADMVVNFNASVSTWDLTLSGFLPPGDYDINEGVYLGWCADMNVNIDWKTGTHYSVALYSTYDPAIPLNPSKSNWNVINYIINTTNGLSWWSRQAAIWYFMDPLMQLTDPILDPVAQGIVNDALNPTNNASGFEPGPGQVMAVLADPREDVQPAIVEVPVSPVPEGSTLLLFGSGLSGLLFFARKKRLLKF